MNPVAILKIDEYTGSATEIFIAEVFHKNNYVFGRKYKLSIPNKGYVGTDTFSMPIDECIHGFHMLYHGSLSDKLNASLFTVMETGTA